MQSPSLNPLSLPVSPRRRPSHTLRRDFASLFRFESRADARPRPSPAHRGRRARPVHHRRDALARWRAAQRAAGAPLPRPHHRQLHHPRPGRPLRADPGRRAAGAGRRIARTRHRAAVQPPGRGLGRGAARRARGHRHPHRLGQVAVLHAAGGGSGDDRAGQGAVPVPDQGAGAGPGGRAAGPQPCRRPRGEGLHLRRRHPRRCAPGDPPARRHRGQQPGHAAPGDPAASHQVGAVLREPALCGDRRDPHLPRRVRQPRRQRAAPAQAHLRVLWRHAAVHPVLGHHR
ncbi:hypothetical protein NB706_001474 [Xanthomonas sacchari]|nr:hypothetical protein [Xanthomonas sacchari]